MKCEHCGDEIKGRRYAVVFGNIVHEECIELWFEENERTVLYDNTVYIDER